MNKFIAQLNLIQKTLLTIASSIVTYWLLDGFEVKLLEDVLFRLINIVFSWSFDSKFGLNHSGYLHPDFIFTFCIVGLIIFRKINYENNQNDNQN